MFWISQGTDKERVVHNGDSFELCGGLHLAPSGHNPDTAPQPAAEGPGQRFRNSGG
jgi:hypothetical protein